MPVGKISMYGEKEILLRGPMFHVVGMTTEILQDKHIYHYEVVMLNVNRDHGTELGINEGAKKEQRDFFRSMVEASRYEICAVLARRYSLEESEAYTHLAKKAISHINLQSPVQNIYNEDLVKQQSHSRPTWHGSTTSTVFPQFHAESRAKWQKAIAQSDWVTVQGILALEYDWKRSEWFNYFGLKGG